MSRKFAIALFAALVLAFGCDRSARRAAELEAFWDNYDFTSLEPLTDIKAAERRFADYAEALNDVTAEQAQSSVGRFMESVAVNEVALYIYMEWFEIYFHSLGSPYRNDDIYASYLDWLLESAQLDDYARLRPAYQRRLLDKNRVGGEAEDFTMRSGGVDFRLSDLRGQRVLLLFVDAECSSCREMMDEIQTSRPIRRAVERGRLRLVAVASGGGQTERLTADYEPLWTVAVCPTDELFGGERYDMSLTPSYFLINADGVVEIAYDTNVSDAVAPVTRRR